MYPTASFWLCTCLSGSSTEIRRQGLQLRRPQRWNGQTPHSYKFILWNYFSPTLSSRGKTVSRFAFVQQNISFFFFFFLSSYKPDVRMTSFSPGSLLHLLNSEVTFMLWQNATEAKKKFLFLSSWQQNSPVCRLLIEMSLRWRGYLTKNDPGGKNIFFQMFNDGWSKI